MKRQVFKNYEPNQLSLPLDLSILIPNNHIVKIVSDIIDSIDISPLLALYEGGGTSAYHPKMLLKVIIYAYTQKIYSGRAMEQQLKENIFFMWISGKNIPNFRTINRFRTEKMKDHVESIFTSVIKLLIEQEYIKFENYFLDGTKIEANANKYSFVWKKSTEKYEKALQDKIKKLLKDINLTVQEENSSSDDKDNDASKKISSEELKKAVDDGSEVWAYCTWSCTDLLSWLNGYQKRYGFIYVDQDETQNGSLNRYKKDSYFWYKNVIDTNGEVL